MKPRPSEATSGETVSGFANTLRVFGFLGSRIRQFFIGVIGISILLALVAVVQAFLVKTAMNAVIGGDASALFRSGAALALVFLVNGICQPRLWKLFMDASPLAARDVQAIAMEAVQRLPMDFFETGHSGDTIARINGDVRALLGVFGVRFRRFVTPVIYALFLSAAMVSLEWRFAAILILINIAVADLNLAIAKPVRRLGGAIQKGYGALSGRAVDLLAGIACVKMFPQSDRLIAGFAGENRRLAGLQGKRAFLMGALSGLNAFLGLAGNLGAVFLGLYFLSRGSIDLGALLAFVSLQADVGRSFLEAAEYFPVVQHAFAGADRLFEILDAPGEPERRVYPTDAGAEAPAGAAIEFRAVGFSYVPGHPVLNGLSFSAPRGRVAALVGASGGGKTTALKLILGFHQADSGAILIGGRPYGDYTLAEIRRLCAWVPQEPYLFDGSIEENLRLGNPGATPELIRAAAADANILEFIESQADGFAARVGQAGISLSGGQRQRIAIARALVKDAPILLLDEATSHLDSRSEQLVQTALARLMAGRTSIVVAHRLSTIRRADVIYVVEGGRVAEAGTHEDLLGRKGAYFRLWIKLTT
jgi:ABC-type multidrug transport system fused ATPase/permease subunit